jgi:uncharacterized RmlC-like cupin family protein
MNPGGPTREGTGGERTRPGEAAVNPGVWVVGPADLRPGEVTSRPATESVFAIDGFDLCRARLDGESSPWHHHGDRTVYGVVLDGRGRIEFGVGGTDSIAVGPGAFFRVPPGVVHREVADGTQVALVGFAGEGPLVVEVDAPDTAPSARPAVAGDDDLVPAGWLANVTRLMPFPDAPVQQVRGHAAGDVASSWHHHGDNHVFGYVLGGEGYTEWGTGPNERAHVREGEWFHTAPGVVHRDVNPSAAEQEYLLWLVGSDPRTVVVDGPDAE